MDKATATDYATFAELERYCRRVAGSIGRLSLGVFECSDRARAEPLADDLGIALQIGNILRDLGEDSAGGRVYLPREDLDRFGCDASPAGFEGPIELVIAFEAERGLGRLRAVAEDDFVEPRGIELRARQQLGHRHAPQLIDRRVAQRSAGLRERRAHAGQDPAAAHGDRLPAVASSV